VGVLREVVIVVMETSEGEEQEAVLDAVHLLGNLYSNQGRLGEAEQMYERALRGKEEALGLNHTSTLDTVNNLGLLYKNQGKLGEAEQMYERALRGYEALSSVRVQQYLPALNTLQNMGDLYAEKDESAKARAVYTSALSGLNIVLSPSSERCVGLAAKIDALPSPRREREGQSKLATVGERSAPQHEQRKKSLRLSIRRLVRKVF
jgi:tetratricopeptide (TPR) repeat protein